MWASQESFSTWGKWITVNLEASKNFSGILFAVLAIGRAEKIDSVNSWSDNISASKNSDPPSKLYTHDDSRDRWYNKTRAKHVKLLSISMTWWMWYHGISSFFEDMLAELYIGHPVGDMFGPAGYGKRSMQNSLFYDWLITKYVLGSKPDPSVPKFYVDV